MNFMNEQEGATPGGDTATDGAGEMESEYVASEPKKGANPAVLGLLCLAVAGAALWFLYLKPGPVPAAAAEGTAAVDVSEFLASGQQHNKLMREMLKETDKVVERFHQYPTKTQIPLASLLKNPFQRVTRVAAVVSESEVAAKRRLDLERQEVAEAVKKLQLQSVMHGGTRQACMINGKFYPPGAEIDGFAIESITAEGVVVRKKGVAFKLTMRRAG